MVWATLSAVLALIARSFGSSGGPAMATLVGAWPVLVGGVGRLGVHLSSLRQARAPGAAPYQPLIDLLRGAAQAAPLGLVLGLVAVQLEPAGQVAQAPPDGWLIAWRLGALVLGGAGAVALACVGLDLNPGEAGTAREAPRRSLPQAVWATAWPTAIIALAFGTALTAVQLEAGLGADDGWWPRHLAASTVMYAFFLGIAGAMRATSEARARLVVVEGLTSRRFPSPLLVGGVLGVAVYLSASSAWPSADELPAAPTLLGLKAAWAGATALAFGALGAARAWVRESQAG